MIRPKSQSERTVQLLEFAYGDRGTSPRQHYIEQNLSRLATAVSLDALSGADLQQLPAYQRDFSTADYPTPKVRMQMAEYIEDYSQYAEAVLQLRRDVAEGDRSALIGEGESARVYKLMMGTTPYAVRIHKPNAKGHGFEDAYELMRRHAEVADNPGFTRLAAINLQSATTITEYAGTSLKDLLPDDAMKITAEHFQDALVALAAADERGVSIDAHGGNVCFDQQGDRLVHIDPSLATRHTSPLGVRIVSDYLEVLESTGISWLAHDDIQGDVSSHESVAALKAQRHLVTEFRAAVRTSYGGNVATTTGLEYIWHFYHD